MTPPLQLTLRETRATSVSSWAAGIREFQLDDIFDTAVLGRSYEYVSTVRYTTRERLTVSALILSSNYEVHIQLADRHIHATCSCLYTGPCKHIAAVLLRLRQQSDEEE